MTDHPDIQSANADRLARAEGALIRRVEREGFDAVFPEAKDIKGEAEGEAFAHFDDWVDGTGPMPHEVCWLLQLRAEQAARRRAELRIARLEGIIKECAANPEAILEDMPK